MRMRNRVVQVIAAALAVSLFFASCATTLPQMEDGKPVRAEDGFLATKYYYQDEEQMLDQNSIPPILEQYPQTASYASKYRTRVLIGQIIGYPAYALMLTDLILLLNDSYSLGLTLTWMAMLGVATGFGQSGAKALSTGVEIYNQEIVGAD